MAQKFNAAPIMRAIISAEKANGAIVRAIVDARQGAEEYDAGTAIEALENLYMVRVERGDIDPRGASVKISKCRLLLGVEFDVLMDAVGRVPTMGLNAVHAELVAIRKAAEPATKPGRGRPAGKGAGKTKPAGDKAAAEVPTVANNDASWKMFIEGMRAQVNGRKDWAASDIAAFQDCATMMIALIQRNAK